MPNYHIFGPQNYHNASNISNDRINLYNQQTHNQSANTPPILQNANLLTKASLQTLTSHSHPLNLSQLKLSNMLILSVQRLCQQANINLIAFIALYNIVIVNKQMEKPSEKTLQNQITYEKVGDMLLYYSHAIKPGKTFGMDINRLFLLDRSHDELSYLDQKQNLPFKEIKNVPLSKKGRPKASQCVIQPVAKTNNLSIKFLLPDPKDPKKKVANEWVFNFRTPRLMNLWRELLLEHQKEVKAGKQKPIQNSNSNNRNAEQNDNDSEAEDAVKFLMTDSRLFVNKPKEDNEQSRLAEQKRAEQNRKAQQRQEARRAQERRAEQQRAEQKRLQQQRRRRQPSNPSPGQRKPIPRSTQRGNQWNYRFYKQPTRETIYEFEQAAMKAFGEIIQTHINKNTNQLRSYEAHGLNVRVVDNFTPDSKRLKNQFRNYHYLLESQQKEQGFVLGVPLACLIQYCGFVGVVKAAFPPEVAAVKDARELGQALKVLEKYTNINSQILYRGGCSFYNLSGYLDDQKSVPVFYVDELFEYLPQFTVNKKPLLLRPQMLLEGVGRTPGGNLDSSNDEKIKNHLLNQLEQQIKQVARFLSSEQVYITNILDLKQLLHDRGLNMKLLPKVKNSTNNKFVKSYLTTALVAKVCKDYIVSQLAIVSKQKSTAPEKYLGQTIKLLVESASVDSSNLWKTIEQRYRQEYGELISLRELRGGFFLSSLLSLIPADYKFSTIDRNKEIFLADQIIGPDFVTNVRPKVKSFHRFQNQPIELAKHSQKQSSVYSNIVRSLSLDSQPLSRSIPPQGRNYILAYLSDFIDGDNNLKCFDQIRNLVNSEPPSAATLKITTNLLGQALVRKDDKNFEATIDKSFAIIQYWLGAQHPEICQLLDKQAAQKSQKGETEASIALLEESLRICENSQNSHLGKTGSRRYVLGQQQIKAGKKSQAVENLRISQEYLRNAPGKQHEYALVLLSLSSIELSTGQTNNSIQLSQQSIKVGENAGIKDRYLIRAYELQCRALEINEQWDQMRKLSIKCAKKFNNSDSNSVVLEMIKVGLTGTFAKLSVPRSEKVLKLANELLDEGKIQSEDQSLRQLKKRAENQIFMETFITKSEQSEKIWAQKAHQRALLPEYQQYLELLRLIIGCVGISFLEGLDKQKSMKSE